MNIDHHLQLLMIKKLAKNETAVKYSDLKEQTTDNSLFSYHLTKLINRGMIVKNDDGYQLSSEGARWLNDSGMALRQKERPRVSVVLVIQDENNNYLIGQRIGQFKAVINDYIFPSNYYVNDSSISDQVNNTIEAFIPSGHLLSQAEFGLVQIEATYKNDKTMRHLFSVTLCSVKNFRPLRNVKSYAEYEWLDLEAIEQVDHPSAVILRAVIAYVQENKNQHITPIFIG